MAKRPRISRDVHLADLEARAFQQSALHPHRLKQVELLCQLKQAKDKQKLYAFEQLVAERQLQMLNKLDYHKYNASPISSQSDHLASTAISNHGQGAVPQAIAVRQRIPLPHRKSPGKLHYITEYSETTHMPKSPVGYVFKSNEGRRLYGIRNLHISQTKPQPLVLGTMGAMETSRVRAHNRSSNPQFKTGHTSMDRSGGGLNRQSPSSFSGEVQFFNVHEDITPTLQHGVNYVPEDFGSKLSKKLKSLITVETKNAVTLKDMACDPDVTLTSLKSVRSPNQVHSGEVVPKSGYKLKRSVSVDSFYQDEFEEHEIEKIWKSPINRHSGSAKDLLF